MLLSLGGEGSGTTATQHPHLGCRDSRGVCLSARGGGLQDKATVTGKTACRGDVAAAAAPIRCVLPRRLGEGGRLLLVPPPLPPLPVFSFDVRHVGRVLSCDPLPPRAPAACDASWALPAVSIARTCVVAAAAGGHGERPAAPRGPAEKAAEPLPGSAPHFRQPSFHPAHRRRARLRRRCPPRGPPRSPAALALARFPLNSGAATSTQASTADNLTREPPHQHPESYRCPSPSLSLVLSHAPADCPADCSSR